MKKVKILYLITKDDIGGAQKYVHDLAEKLDKEKFEIEILTGGPSTLRQAHGGEQGRTTSSEQAKIHFLSNTFRPYFLFMNDWLAVAELFFILHKEKPDILHLNSSKAGVIGAIAGWLYKKTLLSTRYTLHPKIIFTAHGWVFSSDNDLSWLRRQFYILLHKIAAYFQDKIINVSEYDRRLAIKYRIAPPEKLITIHNGIDYQNLKFLDKTTARKALLKLLPATRYTLHANDTWIGSIGRLVKEKNYETFVKTAALIKDPQVKFFIIGGGAERENLEHRIHNLGLQNKFFLIENLTPAAPYIKAFDIFVLSSIKEGLPYTLLEAMAAGLPIITTRIGGMPEIIEGNGLVVLPKEPEELARAIKFLLNDPQKTKELTMAAQKAVKERLGIEKMVKKTMVAYQGL